VEALSIAFSGSEVYMNNFISSLSWLTSVNDFWSVGIFIMTCLANDNGATGSMFKCMEILRTRSGDVQISQSTGLLSQS